ncbi:MAG: hypothetical protein GY810_15065 [Aureispira sp.]|nr:hypothetical protein [Aureispira sp.]
MPNILDDLENLKDPSPKKPNFFKRIWDKIWHYSKVLKYFKTWLRSTKNLFVGPKTRLYTNILFAIAVYILATWIGDLEIFFGTAPSHDYNEDIGLGFLGLNILYGWVIHGVLMTRDNAINRIGPFVIFVMIFTFLPEAFVGTAWLNSICENIGVGGVVLLIWFLPFFLLTEWVCLVIFPKKSN